MAKAIVTQEVVVQVAEELVTAGIEPSILNIQDKIGGGSYTTVKKYLDEWRAARPLEKIEGIELPGELNAKGAELMRALWVAANKLAA